MNTWSQSFISRFRTRRCHICHVTNNGLFEQLINVITSRDARLKSLNREGSWAEEGRGDFFSLSRCESDDFIKQRDV